MGDSKDIHDLEKKKIDNAIERGIPVSITTYTLPANVQNYLQQTVSYFLHKLDNIEIKDYVLYCLNELVVNAKKANTKRVYFKDNNLNIFNPNDYEKGMADFKSETLENIDYYLKLQKQAGLYVKITIQKVGDNLKLEVRNNATLTVEEEDRVHSKIQIANKYSDLSEAITQIVDETEGAGLGLIIMILMLKKINIKSNGFSIQVVGNETVSTVLIPLDTKYKAEFETLKQAIVDHIDKIPQFPEKIMHIQRLINDPNSSIASIAKGISDDVGLTADLLKFVNSASFGLKVKCINITEAVKLVGIRGLQNLLYLVGTVNTFAKTDTTDEQKHLWDEAYQTAFYSYNLAKMLKIRTIIDDSYVCGLLHNIGKIIFSGIYPNLLNELETVKLEKNIPQKVFDIITSDMKHSEIGATLTEKWMFPPQITATIRYQDDLPAAPKEYLGVTATVAMASLMVEYNKQHIAFDEIPPVLLKLFKIENESYFQKLCATFERSFENSKEDSV